jgi:hypothetical protein
MAYKTTHVTEERLMANWFYTGKNDVNILKLSAFYILQINGL